MKIKQKNQVVNNQEDEDGFSLNPVNDFIYESRKVKQYISSKRNTANSEPGSAKLIMISSETAQKISRFIHSPASKQADTISIGIAGNQKNHCRN